MYFSFENGTPEERAPGVSANSSTRLIESKLQRERGMPDSWAGTIVDNPNHFWSDLEVCEGRKRQRSGGRRWKRNVRFAKDASEAAPGRVFVADEEAGICSAAVVLPSAGGVSENETAAPEKRDTDSGRA